MATEVIVRVKVQGDQSLKQLEQDVKSLGGTLQKVDKNSDGASKGLQKVADNGGAIATLDALTGGLASRVRDAAEATKLFNFSLKGTRAALLATGIGALVVSLGLIVGYWDEIVELIGGANRKLERQIELNNENIEILDKELELLDIKEKTLIAEGKSTEQIKKSKIEIIKLQQLENQELLKNLKTKLLLAEEQTKELSFFQKLSNVFAIGGVGRISEATKDELDVVKEINQQLQDAEIQAAKLELALIEINKPAEENQAQRRDIGKAIGTDDIEQGRVRPRLEAELAANTEIVNARIETAAAIQETNRLIEQSDKEVAQQRIELEEAVQQAKTDSLLNGLALASQIAGEQSKVGKAFAVAQATISGIEGVQNAFTTAAKSPITTLFPAYPTIQAGLAAAFSALQIKKILSTDPTGKTPPNLGGGFAGGGVQAPAFNVVGTSGVNQLAETLNQDQQPLQAFVVGNEVTTQQAMDRNIVQTATIG